MHHTFWRKKKHAGREKKHADAPKHVMLHNSFSSACSRPERRRCRPSKKRGDELTSLLQARVASGGQPIASYIVASGGLGKRHDFVAIGDTPPAAPPLGWELHKDERFTSPCFRTAGSARRLKTGQHDAFRQVGKISFAECCGWHT